MERDGTIPSIPISFTTGTQPVLPSHPNLWGLDAGLWAPPQDSCCQPSFKVCCMHTTPAHYKEVAPRSWENGTNCSIQTAFRSPIQRPPAVLELEIYIKASGHFGQPSIGNFYDIRWNGPNETFLPEIGMYGFERILQLEQTKNGGYNHHMPWSWGACGIVAWQRASQRLAHHGTVGVHDEQAAQLHTLAPSVCQSQCWQLFKRIETPNIHPAAFDYGLFAPLERVPIGIPLKRAFPRRYRCIFCSC